MTKKNRFVLFQRTKNSINYVLIMVWSSTILWARDISQSIKFSFVLIRNRCLNLKMKTSYIKLKFQRTGVWSIRANEFFKGVRHFFQLRSALPRRFQSSDKNLSGKVSRWVLLQFRSLIILPIYRTTLPQFSLKKPAGKLIRIKVLPEVVRTVNEMTKDWTLFNSTSDPKDSSVCCWCCFTKSHIQC